MDAADGLTAVHSVIERSKETWLLSHETRRERLDSIMEEGIVPQLHDFRGIQDRMTFATDAKDGDFRRLRRAGVKRDGKDAAFVVFNRPEGFEHVYQFLARRKPEELRRVVEEGLAEGMKDWFVSTKVVAPENIALVYRFDGQVLYYREPLSQ